MVIEAEIFEKGEGSPGRKLDLETYLADVSIGCSNPPQDERGRLLGVVSLLSFALALTNHCLVLFTVVTRLAWSSHRCSTCAFIWSPTATVSTNLYDSHKTLSVWFRVFSTREKPAEILVGRARPSRRRERERERKTFGS